MVEHHWLPLSLLPVGLNWVYTPPVKGYFFRLSFIPPFRAYQVLVAQCQLASAKLEIFDTRMVYPRSEVQVFKFEPPPVFSARRIGLRGLAGQKALIKLEVSSMPFYGDPNAGSSNTGSTTTVAASITSVALLAANPNRKGLTIYNNSSLATLYVGFGATVSASNFAVKIAPSTTWECPQDYDGQLSGIWSVANGGAQITEFA